MKAQYFYSSIIGQDKLPTIEKFCNEHDIDFESINTDYDDEVIGDYSLNNIPALIMYNDNDIRIATHYGRLDDNKLNQMYLKTID